MPLQSALNSGRNAAEAGGTLAELRAFEILESRQRAPAARTLAGRSRAENPPALESV